jgi:hypothetical protein
MLNRFISSRLIKSLIIIFIVVLSTKTTLMIVDNRISQVSYSNKLTSSIAPSPLETPIVPSPVPLTTNNLNLKNSIQKVIDIYPQLNLGVSFIDLVRGERVDINGNKIFNGASTTKVLIACLLLSRVEAGKISLDQTVDDKTISEHLRLMINKSDNDSWESLMKFIGFQ